MHHGRTVPGFPAHPHRGFKTVTVVRKGLIDHADSLGATARLGGGDVRMHCASDANVLTTEVSCIAESLRSANAADPLPPRPESWAAQAGADLANWTLKMAPGACWTLPAATGASTRRSLYFFMGYAMSIDGQGVGQHAAFELQAGQAVTLINGDQSAECLLLEGRPINEPVAQHRSVVNTRSELQQAHDHCSHTL